MTKEITNRMEALTNLAKYSTEITLIIPTEFIEDNEKHNNFREKLQKSIKCLLNDDKNDVTILPYYWDNSKTVIDIKVKEEIKRKEE